MIRWSFAPLVEGGAGSWWWELNEEIHGMNVLDVIRRAPVETSILTKAAAI